MLAVDTETTGHDLQHGCKPFFVSTCDDGGTIRWWEWDVDPYTRDPNPPRVDIGEVHDLLNHDVQLVFHNTKFDVRALQCFNIIGRDVDDERWWAGIHDTLIASHVLASGEPHGLKELALQYLDITDDDQQALRDAVNHARRIGRKLGWRIAEANDPHFPSLKRAPRAGWWVMDTWLPRAVCQYATTRRSSEQIDNTYTAGQLADPDHPWWTVLQRYAITDAERTIGLWVLFERALRDERVEDPAVYLTAAAKEAGAEPREVSLWDIYEHRRRLLSTVYRMESVGVTYSRSRLDATDERLKSTAVDASRRCLEASGVIDNLQSPKQLQAALYHGFNLSPIKSTKTGHSTDKDTLNGLLLQCEPDSRPHTFITNLQRYRKAKVARQYIESYHLGGKPVDYDDGHLGSPHVTRRSLQDWFILHPSFNITGTRTTRFSGSDPNAQNISKQDEINLREMFGPLPGRVWYAMDYSNIEMRIFAYASGDQSLIDAFESGKAVHLVFSQLLHPELYAECERDGVSFKDRYKATWYQWVKNGNFALIYGAGEERADLTYRVPGAYRLIRHRMPLIDSFMSDKYREGKRTGRIITLGGYPLQVSASEPHAAVNYFVQGSAGWCMVLAMNRIDAYLCTLPPSYRMVMTIHDELVFDFPRHPRNLTVVRNLKHLMEKSGDDIDIPTPVEVDRITTDWASGEELKLAA